MNNRSHFNPVASGTPAATWKSRHDPLAADWHSSSTRQGGSAWRAALVDAAESVAALPVRGIEP